MLLCVFKHELYLAFLLPVAYQKFIAESTYIYIYIKACLTKASGAA